MSAGIVNISTNGNVKQHHYQYNDEAAYMYLTKTSELENGQSKILLSWEDHDVLNTSIILIII